VNEPRAAMLTKVASFGGKQLLVQETDEIKKGP
jgi:hypothetical protein